MGLEEYLHREDIPANIKEAIKLDIAERRRAEGVLAAEKERLVVTLHSIGDGVISTDAAGSVIMMNKVAEELTGWNQEEAQGRPLEKVFHIIDEKTRQRCENPVKKVIETGRIVGLANNTALIARDGAERIIADSGAPIRDRDGQIIGVVLVFRDITEKRKREREAALLAEASSVFSSSLDFKEILDKVAKLVSEGIGETCTIFEVEGKHLSPITTFRKGREDKNRFKILAQNLPPLQGSVAGLCVKNREPILIPDTARDRGFINFYRQSLSVRSYICVPLIARGEVLGVLAASIVSEGRQFDTNDLRLAVALADRAAAALENSNLYVKAKAQAARLSVVNEISRAVNSTLDIESVYKTMAEALKQVLPFAFIMNTALYRPEDDTFVFSHLYDPAGVIHSIIKVNQPYPRDSLALSKAFKTKKTYHVRDARKVSFKVQPRELFVEKGILSFLSLPLIVDQECIGTLNISAFDVGAFTEEEIALLETISSHLAIAIKNAKVYEGLQKEIADRKRAEEALRESEERYRTLTEHTYDLISEISLDRRYLYLSPNYKDVLGYEPDELLGREVFELMHPGDRSAAMAEFARAIGSLSTGQAVFRYKHRNGEWRWFEGTGKPFRTATGEIRGVMASRDITEKRKMEEELQKASKLESIGTLAGGIAHDFNNIIMAILGNVSLAKMMLNPEDECCESLTVAEKAALRAKDLAQQLLTFSKGGSPIKKTASISELIEDTVNFALIGSNVKAEYFLPHDLWPVEVDEGQISQVINNIIINADQAMPKGGMINVRAENMTVGAKHLLPLKDGEYVKISIEDKGVGISETNLQKIFDPYFTTKQEGSGLGLATSYSIIKKHDGYIDVESEMGVGTTFHIYLPASQKVARTKRLVKGKPLVGRGKILIMDDEKDIRKFLGQALTHFGYEVELAQDGAEAINLYIRARESGQPFDLVMMDLTIPGGMGGKEAIQKLVEIDPQVKAIVSSGYSKDMVMADFRRYGFSGFIAKPYNIQELSEILNSVITGRGE